MKGAIQDNFAIYGEERKEENTSRALALRGVSEYKEVSSLLGAKALKVFFVNNIRSKGRVYLSLL